MLDVIAYGIVCLDYIWRVPRLPEPGGGASIDEETAAIGGEAANTALPLQRWGVDVAVVGNALGDEERSVLLRGMLQDAFLAPNRLIVPYIPEAVVPFCTCIATPDGHRTMFGKGFGERIHPPLDPHLAEAARFFTIDSTGYTDVGKESAVLAARCGATVVAMDCQGVPEICDLADTLQVSSEHLPFRDADDEEAQLAAWAREMRDRHGAHVIVTHGPKGCIVAERGGACYTVPACPIEPVVDSTGSGDVFRAGYLYGRVQGWDMLRTLRFASAAASFNCGAMGGCGGIAPVDALLDRITEPNRAARAI